MSFRYPRNDSIQRRSGSLAAVEAEILQARAEALARIGGRLQDALRALEDFDAAHQPGHPPDAAEALRRRDLVCEAGEALWYFVVQREASGLRDTDAVVEELRVPREVRLRMGFSRKRS